MKNTSLDRINRILFFLVLLFTVFYFASSILVPLFFGILFSMLMHKVANYFEDKGFGKGLSAVLCTVMFFIAIVGLGVVLTRQLSLFIEDLPELMDQLSTFYDQMRLYFSQNFGISYSEQEQFLQSTDDLADRAGEVLQTALEAIMSLSLGFFIVLIYMILMLLNRDKFINVLKQVADDGQRDKVLTIASKASNVAQQYLWGRIQVMAVLGVMYLITFLAFGIEYALLLTIFGTLITIIPYIGPFMSGILPIAIALITGEPFDTVLFLSVIVLIIQLIESYVLEPVLMGSEVNLSPLTIIVTIFVGHAVWGIAGMILFVPMVAMLKIYFDNTEHLEPYGQLIGSNHKKTNQLFKNLIDKFRS